MVSCRRQRRPRWLALVLVAGAAWLSSMDTARGSNSPPHVVIYLIDALRADHLRCYGYARPVSPVIDRFARENVQFRSAYAPSSWTRSSVASVLTGVYPSRHGALRRQHRVRGDVTMISEVLHDHGYATAAFSANPSVLPAFGFDSGFDTFIDVDARSRHTNAEDVHRAVFNYLDHSDDRPKFLYVHTLDPHDPYAPPPPYDFMFIPLRINGKPWRGLRELVGKYDGEIAYNDREFARFLRRLKREGIYDDALIFLVSDHGEEFHDHGWYRHGRTVYQELIRVPLVVRLPGGRKGGRLIDEPTRIMDIAPTICRYLDIPAPGLSDSPGFLAALEGRRSPGQTPVLYSELNLDKNLVSCLVSGEYKLVRRHLPKDERGIELYNLVEDPRETSNLAESSRKKVEELKRRLDRIEASHAEGLFVELINAEGLDSNCRFEGKIVVTGGVIESAALHEGEGGDRIEVGPGSTTLEFACGLENAPNPVRANTISVDIDRIRLDLEPATAAVTLEITVDEDPLPPSDIVVASAPGGPTAGRYNGQASSLVPESRGWLQSQRVPGENPSCLVYYLPGVESESAKIDPALDERLRALGYLN